MQLRKWVLVSGVIAAALWTSCNEAGSSKDNPDSTNVTSKESRTTKTVEVPAATRTSFEAKYPQASDVTWNYHEPVIEAPIEWEWTSWPAPDTNDYVANFKVNEDDYWVWYDDSGDWIGTVSEVNDNSSLPSPVNDVIKTQFADYKITSIDKENDKNRTAYEIKLEKGEDKMKLLIDQNGQVLKKKGKIDGEKIKEKNKPEDK
jgi:hypothetical protein